MITNQNKTGISTKKITALGLLSAISIVLILLIRFPVFPAAPFLEYDPADVPILIATMAYGPIAGLLVTFVASAIQAFTVSAASGPIGFAMHVLATGSMVLVLGTVYRKWHTVGGLLAGLIGGSLVMTGVMAALNLVMMPLFMGVDRQIVLEMMVPVILPFNLLKAGINSAATFVLGKSLEKTKLFG